MITCKGTLSLIYKKEVIYCLTYQTAAYRQQLIDRWKKQTGLRFEQCEIKDEPVKSDFKQVKQEI